MDNILKDFRLNSKVPDAVIENYKNIVPLEIINLWQDYGFGSFMQGYLKSVNP